MRHCLLLVLLVLTGCPPTEEMRKEVADRAAEWDRNNSATPERWAKCRAVCGEGAAMLPTGAGYGVVCSCLPANARVEVRP